MRLQPTGHCFDDALDYLTELAKHRLLRPDNEDEYTLVHAICTAPTDGHAYSHAWIEQGDGAWLGALMDGERVFVELELEPYRAKLKIQDETRYTVRQALDENWKHGHYGPWKPEYIALCKDKQPQIVSIDQHES